MNNSDLPVDKSEILFLYESTYSIPNGDPFTGEQRYDEETKRILVSDVRIKRFIRDHLADQNPDQVYVLNERSSGKKGEETKDAESGAASRFNYFEGKADNKGKGSRGVLTSLIDVRLFGGISTKKGDAVNLTGPVQFALLNPSLNAVELRMHQNTSVFASRTDNTRGAIGTTTVVPYALNQIHGWVNPYSARQTNLKPEDVQAMFQSLWESVNNANTRTKSNQNSLLLLQVVYTEPTKKLYGLDRSIHIASHENKKDEQLRSRDDYDLDFSRLQELVRASSVVSAVNFYTDDTALRTQLSELDKFSEMALGA